MNGFVKTLVVLQRGYFYIISEIAEIQPPLLNFFYNYNILPSDLIKSEGS